MVLNEAGRMLQTVWNDIPVHIPIWESDWENPDVSFLKSILCDQHRIFLTGLLPADTLLQNHKEFIHDDPHDAQFEQLVVALLHRRGLPVTFEC